MHTSRSVSFVLSTFCLVTPLNIRFNAKYSLKFVKNSLFDTQIYLTAAKNMNGVQQA